VIRNLWHYLKNILCTPLFWGCVVICTILRFTTICYVNEAGKEYTIFELLFHKQELWDTVSAEIPLSDILESLLGTYALMFMPVVVIFPFLNYFWAERMTGYSRFVVARIGKVRYAVIRAVSGVLSAGFTAALGCILADVILISLLPAEGLAIGKIWIFKIACFMIYGMLVSTPGLAAAAVFYNKYVVACIPFLAFYLLDLTLEKQGLVRWQTSYFTYFYRQPEPGFNVVFYVVMALVLMAVFGTILTKRRDGCA